MYNYYLIDCGPVGHSHELWGVIINILDPHSQKITGLQRNKMNVALSVYKYVYCKYVLLIYALTLNLLNLIVYQIQ